MPPMPRSKPREPRPSHVPHTDVPRGQVKEVRALCGKHGVKVKQEVPFSNGTTRLFFDTHQLEQRMHVAERKESEKARVTAFEERKAAEDRLRMEAAEKRAAEAERKEAKAKAQAEADEERKHKGLDRGPGADDTQKSR